ncbi:hypothetical protein EXS65_03790 [Candidatus Peribacteria bacterium]|nr:hypothetical protein [Candidatus Peribacteria bacterium]
MSDPYLDHLPSHEREKIRKRLRSPEEYERLREKVKGPEDLEREMEKNSEFADVKLALETEPKSQEKAKDQVQRFVREHGIDSAFEHAEDALKDALSKGNFDVTVDSQSHEPKISVKFQSQPQGSSEAPSGNVSEVFTLKPVLQQQILSIFKIINK